MTHLSGKKLSVLVFFLDETFEEVTFDITTTVRAWRLPAARHAPRPRCVPRALEQPLRHGAAVSARSPPAVALAHQVLEAVEQVSSIIRLQNYTTFTLFVGYKPVVATKALVEGGPGDEHTLLDDNRCGFDRVEGGGV